ncbi:MAG: hypothetical protein JWO86_1220 [Myxococcaceae bacterium]|nr:hypothetical protein [Myxococcaceae bacterium]
MERCDEFEVSIEMRLHGALEAPQTSQLADHLATCASCRAFEDLAKGSENAMNQQTNLHLETLDWDALWKRTRTFFEITSRQHIVSSAVVVLALAPMMMLMEDDVVASVALLGTSWVAAIAWRMWSVRQRLAAVAKYEGDTGELLFFYRRELEDRLHSGRFVLLLVPLWAALVAFRITHPFTTTSQWIGFAGLGVVILSAVAYVWLVRRPRVARELQQLKADLQNR